MEHPMWTFYSILFPSPYLWKRLNNRKLGIIFTLPYLSLLCPLLIDHMFSSPGVGITEGPLPVNNL